MGIFENWPYTNYHDLNLNWVIGKIKDAEAARDEMMQVEADTIQAKEDAEGFRNDAEGFRNDAEGFKNDAKDFADDAKGYKDDAAQSATDATNTVSNTVNQINLLQSRVDNIIPDGTQTAGNTELLDIRVGYNGETYDSAGNAVRGQINDVISFIDDIATFDKSVNRFNPDTISNGYSLDASGDLVASGTEFTSDFIEAEPGGTIYYYRLTSADVFQTNTIMYLAQYDNYKNFISRTTYAASGTVLDANCKFIRFTQPVTQLTDNIIAVTFDTILTKQTIQPFDDKYVINNSEEISYVLRSFEEIETYNKFDPNKIDLNYVIAADGSLTSGPDAFTTEFIKASPGDTVRVYRLLQNGNVQSNTMTYLGQYDENKGFISRTAWAVSGTVLDASCHYIKICLASSVLNDQVVTITLNEPVTRGTISPYYSGIALKDIAGLPAKLKVMTYNIGRYSYGASPYYIDSDFDDTVGKYKKFFSEQQCDILGIEENNIFLDAVSGGSVTTNSMYEYLYPYFSDAGNGASIKSKYPLMTSGMNAFASSGRQYVYATVDINGKELFIMTVHLTPNPGSSEDALRAAEVSEILSIVSTHKYFIVFGDFNAQDTTFYDTFINSNYKIANGGYLPFDFTYSYDPGDYSTDTPSANIRYFDNIVVSENIIIDDSYKLNVYSDLTSDHLPFVAHLTIN